MNNTIIKWWFAAFIAFAVSCGDEVDFSQPVIENVRLTTSAQPLDSAAFGEFLVIQGRHLASVKEVFFNDVKGVLRTTLITDENIVVQVPSTVPAEVTNKVRVVTSGGESSFDLAIKVPGPSIQTFSNEFARDGDWITLTGDFFYNVSHVVFAPSLHSDFQVVDPKTLRVRVPEGSQSGVVEVRTVFGKGLSKIAFRDRSSVFMDFDDQGKCWGGMPEYAASAETAPTPLSGKYVHSYKVAIPGQFWWDDGLVVAHCGGYSTTGSLDAYALKFEINVSEPWLNGWYEMNFSWSHFFRFKPWDQDEETVPFSTGGEWRTISIPLSEFKSKVDGQPVGDPVSDPAAVKDLVLAFQNEGPAEVAVLNVSFDNFRVVKVK